MQCGEPIAFAVACDTMLQGAHRRNLVVTALTLDWCGKARRYSSDVSSSPTRGRQLLFIHNECNISPDPATTFYYIDLKKIVVAYQSIPD